MGHFTITCSEELRAEVKSRAALDRMPVNRWIIQAVERQIGRRIEPPPRKPGPPKGRLKQSEAMKKVWARKKAEKANAGMQPSVGEGDNESDPVEILEMLSLQGADASISGDMGVNLRSEQVSPESERKTIRRCPECRTELQPWLGKLRCMECRENYEL